MPSSVAQEIATPCYVPRGLQDMPSSVHRGIHLRAAVASESSKNDAANYMDASSSDDDSVILFENPSATRPAADYNEFAEIDAALADLVAVVEEVPLHYREARALGIDATDPARSPAALRKVRRRRRRSQRRSLDRMRD